MKDPLDVSPSIGNQGTTRGKEKFLLTSVRIEPTTSGLDLPFVSFWETFLTKSCFLDTGIRNTFLQYNSLGTTKQKIMTFPNTEKRPKNKIDGKVFLN